jgi:hypothetical protein
MGDFANDIKAGIAPEVALEETEIVDSSWGTDTLAIWFIVNCSTLCRILQCRADR